MFEVEWVLSVWMWCSVHSILNGIHTILRQFSQLHMRMQSLQIATTYWTGSSLWLWQKPYRTNVSHVWHIDSQLVTSPLNFECALSIHSNTRSVERTQSFYSIVKGVSTNCNLIVHSCASKTSQCDQSSIGVPMKGKSGIGRLQRCRKGFGECETIESSLKLSKSST